MANMGREDTVLEFEKRPYYSPTQFGEIFGVDPSTVLNWIHSGKLYAVQLGPKTYRIPLAAVMQRVNPQAKPTRVAIKAREELESDERRRTRRVLQAR
jgi:excisionase family DNA binding protein